MFKDPENQDQSPYELLNLTPEVPPEDVHKALVLFMRDPRNIPRLGKAKEAVKHLKDPLERAKIDIWFYDIEIPPAAAPDAAVLAIDDFCQVPYSAPEFLDSDLESPGPPPELRPIAYLKPTVSEQPRYDGWDATVIRPHLDL